ncbi:insulin-like growth factor 2 mRNA-binding protein 2 [Amyelois transitella]|uniref:insulin-like growth factor 2 mRNA-binding protein 2 n=1 Tax=Amyelois transitella TaxID=680683 RepID=UPI00298F99E2|nr:insulin-like growth factor 2 mRNA-binding protein 2 [Amyelois transitella]
MNKLYIGNLPIEADEAAVRQLFAEQNLTVADISVKRGGYAFVDFPDQSAADRAIDKLHGFSYCGLPLVVEPSVANKKILNVPNLQSASTTQLKETSNDTPAGGWKRGLDAPPNSLFGKSAQGAPSWDEPRPWTLPLSNASNANSRADATLNLMGSNLD